LDEAGQWIEIIDGLIGNDTTIRQLLSSPSIALLLEVGAGKDVLTAFKEITGNRRGEDLYKFLKESYAATPVPADPQTPFIQAKMDELMNQIDVARLAQDVYKKAGEVGYRRGQNPRPKHRDFRQW
jgi:hypothetical protein